MNKFDSTDIDATSRLCGNKRVWIAGKLARDNDFLLVASGERTCGSFSGGGAYIKVEDEPLRPYSDVFEAENKGLYGELVPTLSAKDQIILDRISQHQANLAAILWNVGEASF